MAKKRKIYFSGNRKYDTWKRFADKCEQQAESFVKEDHEPCPCCGHTAICIWEWKGDYDPGFTIKCTNCSCSVTGMTWEECLNDWEGHRTHSRQSF